MVVQVIVLSKHIAIFYDVDRFAVFASRFEKIMADTIVHVIYTLYLLIHFLLFLTQTSQPTSVVMHSWRRLLETTMQRRNSSLRILSIKE